MIKVDRNIQSQKIIDARKVLCEEKVKSSGTYNKPEVFEALKLVFNKKCYICENKNITTYNIEHFRPHKDNIDFKFDFDNLLLACAHCNNIKPFTAFKRWIIRDNKENLSEFLQADGMKICI